MRTPPRSSRQTSVAALGLIGLLGLLGLTGCGGSQSVGATAGGSVENLSAPAAAPASASAGPVRAQAKAADLGNTGAGTAPQQADLLTRPALIKTGSVALRSDHLGQVLTRVYGIVGGVGGDVSREDTVTDPHGAVVRSSLVLRVPVESFDTTLNDLGRLGTLVDRVRSSKDVTTEVADVDSRVRSANRSIATLRLLFNRASKLGDIIRLESELSQRESDLEALQAQQRALNDNTTMSTITMSLEREPRAPVRTGHHAATAGFVSGIGQGWHALTTTVVTLGHGLGVVLPLGTVVVLLAGAALWFVRRVRGWPAPSAKPTVEA